jgi:phosphoglycerate-specific signal transduction histidine kinase
MFLIERARVMIADNRKLLWLGYALLLAALVLLPFLLSGTVELGSGFSISHSFTPCLLLGSISLLGLRDS